MSENVPTCAEYECRQKMELNGLRFACDNHHVLEVDSGDYPTYGDTADLRAALAAAEAERDAAREQVTKLEEWQRLADAGARASYEAVVAQQTAAEARAVAAEARAVAAEAERQTQEVELLRLRAEAKGPDGFATWNAAAVDERMKRVAAEAEVKKKDDEAEKWMREAESGGAIISNLASENKRLREALEEIVDPIGAMKRNLPEGHTLDGLWAVRIAEDPAHARGIARTALAAVQHEGTGETSNG